MIATWPYPEAWPAHPETLPLLGIVTETELESAIRDRVEEHVVPPLMLAPPETSSTNLPEVLDSERLSTSPGV